MKFICIGRNYAEHALELGNDIPEEPVIFLKPDTALFRNGYQYYIPEFTQDLHYELEIVVKISKNGKYVQEQNAHSHYQEIGLGIDFTARDLQTKLKSKGLPWELAKAFDNSAVVSEFFSKEDYDLSALNFSLKKNDATVQDGKSSQMIHNIDKIISFVSQFFTLKKGDLIFTGTPKGVGKADADDVLTAYLEDQEVLRLKMN